MTAPGELASVAVRRTALEQVQRLMSALDRELARVEQSQPFDTTAALRLAKTLRQLVPALGELEAQERARGAGARFAGAASGRASEGSGPRGADRCAVRVQGRSGHRG